MALLEVKGIRKKFGDNEVLKGIDFDLEQGEVLTIIGSSGSGKTTLLRCLNYLETADEGTVELDGENVFDGKDKQKLTAEEIRKKRVKFGMVFQSFNLFPHYKYFAIQGWHSLFSENIKNNVHDTFAHGDAKWILADEDKVKIEDILDSRYNIVDERGRYTLYRISE